MYCLPVALNWQRSVAVTESPLCSTERSSALFRATHDLSTALPATGKYFRNSMGRNKRDRVMRENHFQGNYLLQKEKLVNFAPL